MDPTSALPAERVTTRPQGPRTGRRAAGNLIPAVSDFEIVSNDASPVAPAGPRPQIPRRRAGWGDASVDVAQQSSAPAPPPLQALSIDAAVPSEQNKQLTGMSRRKAAQVTAREDRMPEPAVQSSQMDDVDMFMEIPDLEGADDMSRQVATAPAVRSVSVMDIAELESEDLFRLPVVAKDHEVDLSLLTACLCPADEVAEELVIWDYEALLTEMASALHADKDELYHSTARTGQQIAV